MKTYSFQIKIRGFGAYLIDKPCIDRIELRYWQIALNFVQWNCPIGK